LPERTLRHEGEGEAWGGQEKYHRTAGSLAESSIIQDRDVAAGEGWGRGRPTAKIQKGYEHISQTGKKKFQPEGDFFGKRTIGLGKKLPGCGPLSLIRGGRIWFWY